MAILRKKRPLKRKVLRKRRGLGKPKVSTTVKSFVKSAIAKQTENKTASVEANINFGSILQNATMNAYPMLPYTGYLTIPQGVTQGTRIGNICKVKRVTLNYTLLPLGYNITTNPNMLPFTVVLYLGAVKQYKGLLPQSSDVALLYQLGASTVAPSGTLSDLIYNINKDNWDMKKVWTHKIGYAANEWNGGSSTNQYYTNNDFKLNAFRRMDITKHCAKTMKFNDSIATQQGNNLFFMFQTIQSNGTAAPATVQQCNIRFFVTIDYEDA